jgi:hypothetical protein
MNTSVVNDVPIINEQANGSHIIVCPVALVGSTAEPAKNRSDHYPLLLDFQINNVRFASQFKFMRMWTLNPDCEGIIRNCWNTSVTGCHMFVLNKNLKLLKECLKTWNKNNSGNVMNNVKNAEENLTSVQEC